MIAGLVVGILMNAFGGAKIIIDWVAPFGRIFINLLKLIAVPLIFASLVKGITSVTDISSLSRIGGKTITIYLSTTVVSIIIALAIVSIVKPGNSVPKDVQVQLAAQYGPNAQSSTSRIDEIKSNGPLHFLEEIVPSNIVGAMQDNSKMLKVIFFTLLFGIAIILIPAEKTTVIRAFFDQLNEVILKLVDLIMLFAPYGVFALIAALVVENSATILSLLSALGLYALTVVVTLAVMVVLVYPVMLKLLTNVKIFDFFKGISPAQLLAFSTSSSAATLPVTMECCEENLGISKKITSFVLPLGATVNMDGTSIWQTVTTVFLAQLYGYDLSLGHQLTIILTATLSSIGAVGVPGGGIVMLIIVLQSVGLPADGIAIILGIDRILDMCRTVINVTGDSTVATIVASSENEIRI